jgi:small GTP-binding protein
MAGLATGPERGPPPSYKIVVVGASSVGKSSIVQRLVQNTFLEETTMTCGADFYTHTIHVEGQAIRLQIWDTAGQERFCSIAKWYFRNAVGALLVYDITLLTSFTRLEEWYGHIQSQCAPNPCVLLIGNKADLEAQRQVGSERAKEFAVQNGLEPLETSARDGTGVTEAFNKLTHQIYNKVNSGEIRVSQPPPGMAPAREINAFAQCC